VFGEIRARPPARCAAQMPRDNSTRRLLATAGRRVLEVGSLCEATYGVHEPRRS